MWIPVSSLEQIRFESNTEILCGHCQEPLDRHQPDDDQPDRLLGTCSQCGEWYLMDLRASVMYVVPNVWNDAEAKKSDTTRSA